MPASTMDHRCHLQASTFLAAGWTDIPSSLSNMRHLWLDLHCLQAFRHLYVLAAQPRSVDAIDVDTKQASEDAVPVACELHRHLVLRLVLHCAVTV